jgi:hypothetical protein
MEIAGGRALRALRGAVTSSRARDAQVTNRFPFEVTVPAA